MTEAKKMRRTSARKRAGGKAHVHWARVARALRFAAEHSRINLYSMYFFSSSSPSSAADAELDEEIVCVCVDFIHD